MKLVAILIVLCDCHEIVHIVCGTAEITNLIVDL